MAFISLTAQQHEVLSSFIRRRNTPQWLVKRAMIILLLNDGFSIRQTAKQLHLSRNTVRTWLRRWQEEQGYLAEDQGSDAPPVSKRITAVLSDSPRVGRPPTFRPEEIVQIVAIACEHPQKFGRPISHWTTRELADEAMKQGIVKSVSHSSVGRFLKGVDASTSSQPLLALS